MNTMMMSSLGRQHRRAFRFILGILLIAFGLFIIRWSLITYCVIPRTLDDRPDSELLKYFQPVISPEEQETLKDLLQVLVGGLTKNNITFYLGAGALLGSYRHHGLIPWDDDIDIYIPIAEMGKVGRVISQYKGYNVFGYRFYSTQARYRTFSYPYVDLIFYLEDAEYVWDAHTPLTEKYKKSYIFPLSTRPFWGMNLPSPRDVPGYLGMLYNLEECQNRVFSHREERKIPFCSRLSTQCKRLYHAYPFVFRTKTPTGHLVNESLWIGTNMISWKLVKPPI